MKILVTCPPMLGMIDYFNGTFEAYGMEVTAPRVVQTLSVDELVDIVPDHDGWIIGDDPADRRVFEVGRSGRLKAAVKWGIGVDNVDFGACNELDIPITNTPDMFGKEVADIAVSYVTALARETYEIDRGVREGGWPKPRGISLCGKTVALVGFGDIGQNTAKRLLAADMNVIAYDPEINGDRGLRGVIREEWPQRIEKADFIVVTCSLTPTSYHLLDEDLFSRAKSGVRVINVGRGAVIDERALEDALKTGKVYSAALDVFEEEPLPMSSYLRLHSHCILGSHNASNTSDAVVRTSEVAIKEIAKFLGIQKSDVS